MACGRFPQYPQEGEVCEEGEGSVGVMGWGCGGSGSLVEVWEGLSGKNGLDSTSPEPGDTGARGGPGWVVPAAAGCACCEGDVGGGGRGVWIAQDSWVCQEASPDTPPETPPLLHPAHMGGDGGGLSTHPEQEARQGLGRD